MASDSDVHPMTVSQVLAAHAAAQIAAAQQHADSLPCEPAKPSGAHCASFTVGWANVAMCIGFSRPDSASADRGEPQGDVLVGAPDQVGGA